MVVPWIDVAAVDTVVAGGEGAQLPSLRATSPANWHAVHAFAKVILSPSLKVPQTGLKSL